ncbi:exopolyphosphatase/guanosine-5'-triphosphate,3'-diphosphate pyrophosphatase [Kineococcus xinjiangensis]|uniref:Exopolyphosphatase/guanosine-5'-triphosphate, 3'-diphosphate pyrophosphatase n=1 Tax=Kineococcus xinjiangensis TaxID=512762 RepID=A0A2S6IGZ0_9ACTN|nr:Ppx/GppA phosphatase family protein [Kineococcus xinjiangensis]PPK93484.1 exopolyphosphatase/guanosine-5'-triphosphate,3'-diphosphate pyrophosphatase [Kineococcus xinjiangensis]
MRLGVLDVGSNTVHLLVVDAHPGARPLPASSFKVPLRLAEHLDDAGALREAGVEALASTVAKAVDVAEDRGCTELLPFATSAVREAANGEEVLQRVEDATGVRLRVLPGRAEAELTFLAVRRWYGWSRGCILVLDIGGGSLELAAGIDEIPDVAVSLPLGAGRLTRDWLRHDPPKAGEVKELRGYVRRQVASVVREVGRMEAQHVAVTSKTFRSLARIAGAAPSADGPFVRRVLRHSDLVEWVPKLADMSAAKRTELPGVSVERAPQLLAGALVAEAALDLLDIREVEVCPWALREGVILRRLDAIAAGAERGSLEARGPGQGDGSREVAGAGTRSSLVSWIPTGTTAAL